MVYNVNYFSGIDMREIRFLPEMVAMPREVQWLKANKAALQHLM